jgi:hypothetical protein
MSFATLIAEVEADAKAAIAAVEGGVEKIAEAIGPVIITDAEAMLKQLFDLSVQAVLDEAQKVISGTEKFGNAVTSVTQTIEAQGKAVVIQDVQAAVQTSYNIVKLSVSGS